MFKLLCKIPDKFYVACSGGRDSCVVLNFLSSHKGFSGIIHCHHGTKHSDDALNFVKSIGVKNNWGTISKFEFLKEGKPEDQSQEEHWSNWRREVFNSLPHPVITGHKIQDAKEWWIMSSLHGEGKLIPVESGNVLRPFLATSNKEIEDWAERKMVKWIEDPSNQSRKYARNIVRYDIMEHAEKINPGLSKTIRKKYLNAQ